MIKINKDYNSKIVSLIAVVTFLLNSAVYGIELSNNKAHLRVPISSSTLKRVEDVMNKRQAEEPLHIYRQASDKERIKILREVYDSGIENILAYLKLFNEGIRKSIVYGFYKLKILDREGIIEKFKFLDTDGMFEKLEKSSWLNTDRISHEGLIIDEKGIYWIIKRFNPERQARSKIIDAKNFPHHEMLAYLIARGIANMVEIRFPKEDEVKSLNSFTGDINDYYLTRVVTSSNININELPNQERGKAFAGIFVANVLMRKFDQHLGNFGYTHNIPVAVDNDEIFDDKGFPHNDDGLRNFANSFFHHIFIVLEPFLSSMNHF